MSDTPSRWWRTHVHADRRPFLRTRNKMATAARSFFAAQRFVEVDPAALQTSPGNEAHIAAFATTLVSPDGASHPLYLHASPEFAMKKLLAAGEERIFSLGHAFRNGERSRLHHPEFTLLEWYRANAPYQRLIEDCAGLLAALARAAGADLLTFGGAVADPFEELELLTVADAFDRYAGIDLLATIGDGTQDREALAGRARKIGVRVVEDDSWSDLFSKILSAKIEPHLGHGRATVLMDYPACEAALANVQADPRLAERFELYACGVELANAFGELTDPVEQRRRFGLEMAERARIYGDAYPIDEDFLAALSAMPAASGIALGFDRLVMLATGATRIEQVIWTPVDEIFG